MFYINQPAVILQAHVEITGISCTYMYLSEASTCLDLYVHIGI
jgi:hypothetical protein